MPFELQFTNRGVYTPANRSGFLRSGNETAEAEAFIFPGDMEGKNNYSVLGLRQAVRLLLKIRYWLEMGYSKILENACFPFSCFKRDRWSVEEVSKPIFFQRNKRKNKPIMKSLFYKRTTPFR